MLHKGETYRWEYIVDFLTQYWQQLTAFVTLVIVLTRMRVDIDVLKEKVKTIFELWNKREN